MRRTATRLLPSVVLLCAVFTASSITMAQQLNVVRKVTAGTGWTPWYELHTDPSNERNMIICGSKWNSKDNASYGFVYFSSDAGQTWQQTLEDKNSVWVSEESCAYGVHGVVYFVAGASKVIDDDLHHELGTTRIYVSHDSGKNWKLDVTTGWMDYSTSVVDKAAGPNENRLYVFFNNLETFYSSIGNKAAQDKEATKASGTRVGFISYKDGDKQIAGPFSSEEMAQEQYHGAYPAPAIRLKDGSTLTFFTTGRRNQDNSREFLAYTIRVSADGTYLEDPVQIANAPETPREDRNIECGGVYLDSAAAYNTEHDKLYYMYPSLQEKRCRLMLSTSIDGGKSWSKGTAIFSPDETARRAYGNLTIGVSTEGTLAAMWEEKLRSGCWMFAVSNDDGKSLSRAEQLGTCSGPATLPSALGSAYLWTSFFQADTNDKSSVARINLRNTHNGSWRNAPGIAVTSDGHFHVAWIEGADGEGAIRTATIRVTSAATMVSSATKGLKDVTDRVAVTYGGNQTFDARTGMITLDVVLRNKSDAPIQGPFKLVVPGLYKNFGLVEIANADNQALGAGAVWDVGGVVPGGVIAPGAESKPFPLKFRYLADPNLARNTDDILGLTIKVYAAR